MPKEIILNKKIKDYLDRWAGSPKLPHSYLFCGPEGIGKTEAAFYFIQNIAEKKNDEEFLRRAAEGAHPDVMILQPEIVEDKKGRIREREITIEQVRNVQNQLKFFPYELKYKFCLVKKAQRLNKEAANALLKVLEEPTAKTFFILLAASDDAVLPTILSRCAALRFPQTKLPVWQEENRELLRKTLTREIYEKFEWAEKISKNRSEAAAVLGDWESVLAEGLRKVIVEEKKEPKANPASSQRIKRTVAMLGENRKAIDRISRSNANARTILENLVLELQWK